MAAEGHLLVILHELPDPDEPDVRVAKLYWRTPRATWRSTETTETDIGPLRRHVESFVELAERLEERIEKAASAAEYFAVLHAAAPALRTARNLCKTLQEARQAAGLDKQLIAVRDTAQDAERALELIHGYAKDGLEFTIAKNAEQNALNSEHVIRSGHQLNLLAAVFLPITAVGSLLGMNLVHGFEQWNAPYTFWCVAAVSFGLGFWIKSTLPGPKS